MNKNRRVIALGFFDGVHNGHGALLRRVVDKARELDATPAAFTFDPHPQTVILGRPMPLLTSPEDRADLMRKYYGIQEVIVASFDAMQRMDWHDFVARYLVEELGVVHVVAGHDFHFGYMGKGNPRRLQEKCAQLGIGCDIIPKVEQDGITISSTYIRTLVAQGEIERANEFLGHPYTLSDRVSHGKKLGSTLGFPTVNLRLKENVLSPAKGVYATKVILENGETHPAVTNVGTRPTVNNGTDVTVEAACWTSRGICTAPRCAWSFSTNCGMRCALTPWMPCASRSPPTQRPPGPTSGITLTGLWNNNRTNEEAACGSLLFCCFQPYTSHTVSHTRPMPAAPMRV